MVHKSKIIIRVLIYLGGFKLEGYNCSDGSLQYSFVIWAKNFVAFVTWFNIRNC